MGGGRKNELKKSSGKCAPSWFVSGGSGAAAAIGDVLSPNEEGMKSTQDT